MKNRLLGLLLSVTATAHAGDWDGFVSLDAQVSSVYPGAERHETVPMPVAAISWQKTAYVYYSRAGYWAWQAPDRSLRLGLAAEPRFGFKAKADDILQGMTERKTALETGVNGLVVTPLGGFDLAFLKDIAGASDGAISKLQWYVPFRDDADGEWFATFAAERQSARTANYYYGVSSAEATVNRPQFQPGALTHYSLYLGGHQRLTGQWVGVAGVRQFWLDDTLRGSSLVKNRQPWLAHVGLGWKF